MKLSKENLELSGKGAIVSQELLHENIKVIADQTQFHEVVVREDDTTTRVGWIVPNSFELQADFTTHTDAGMKGKSTFDTVERSLILDSESYLSDLLPETLVDIDVTESAQILKGMIQDDDHFNGKINFGDKDKREGMIILSPRIKFVFVQSDKNTIRIHGDDGVYVLNRKDEPEELIIIDRNGVNIYGNKNVSLGPGGLYIDGKLFEIQKIVTEAMAGVGSAIAATMTSLGNLGHLESNNFEFDNGNFHHRMTKFERKMEKFGKKMEKIGDKFGKSFGKNFMKNFHDDFGEEFDTDFSDAYDVDVDF